MARTGSAALLVAGLLLGGCSFDEEPAPDERSEAPTTTTDPAWSPPGTPLVAGLEVPEGAHLLGAPVVVPIEYTYEGVPVRDPDSVRAFLRVTGDPFTVFDTLAAQAREAGFDLPGSAGSCLWSVAVDEESGMDRIEPVAGPALDDEITGVRCGAAAATEETTLDIVLDHDASRPALLEVRTGSPDAEGGPGGSGAAEPTRANRRAELGDTAAAREQEPASFLDAHDPVPAGSADELPAPPASEADARPGDPLLRTMHCRSDTAGGDLVVPEGGRVLGRPIAGAVYADLGDAAVLAVEDAEAVLADLYAQAAGEGGADGEGGFFGEPPSEVDLQDGTSAWRVSFGTSAGGDECEAIASPDGTTVLLHVGRG